MRVYSIPTQLRVAHLAQLNGTLRVAASPAFLFLMVASNARRLCDAFPCERSTCCIALFLRCLCSSLPAVLDAARFQTPPSNRGAMYTARSMFMSPLLKEAAFWFALGVVVAAFMCSAVMILAVSAPGIGSTAALVRAVGKSVDSVLCPDRDRERDRSHNRRPSRRSFEML